MRGLEGRSAIVTGGASGIGRAIAERFGEEGAHVSIYDIDADGAAATAAAISGNGGHAEAVPVDLTDYDAVGAAIRATHEHHGLGIVVNNAGWDRFIPFVDTEPGFWDRVIAVNYRAPLNVLHQAIPLLVASGGGRVVSVASDAGRGGSSGEAVYAGCKAGLMALSKSLAREHSRHAITFNVVCPGPTETPLFAGFMDGVGNPGEAQGGVPALDPHGAARGAGGFAGRRRLLRERRCRLHHGAGPERLGRIDDDRLRSL